MDDVSGEFLGPPHGTNSQCNVVYSILEHSCSPSRWLLWDTTVHVCSNAPIQAVTLELLCDFTISSHTTPEVLYSRIIVEVYDML